MAPQLICPGACASLAQAIRCPAILQLYEAAFHLAMAGMLFAFQQSGHFRGQQ
jgi:hypothetical protein